ncbi:GNAT family N-acetyltransferase [Paenibacillus sp. YPG26]|uniref:GNAT family N-acetyltransferase n=1 Tax=Paenibacillus sp. YPG26 TaxID=2878915 RepID=UPI00203C18F9|nr:GNAT family N-acetyltransferase [Paenibacillus sp. YPG26]USB31587.1 GNAT family N-acetyltransferase [Paenibacillus sp. YPG26]
MQVDLVRADFHLKEKLRNLMQFYIYDFSGYLGFDIDEETGSYPPYPNFDKYWEGNDSYIPYLFKVGSCTAGFALIEALNGKRSADSYMTEFFVLKKYRRQGVGRSAAIQLFEKYRGRWLVSQLSSNVPAQIFWRTIIRDYTSDEYEEDISLDHRQISQRFTS